MEISQFTTISNRHKAGYTKEDCITNRDCRLFDKIDRNGDGILSPSEIIERRKKELKLKTTFDAIGTIAGIILLANGVERGKSLNLIKVSLGTGLLASIAIRQYLLINEDTKTKYYEEELQKLNKEC